MRVYIGKNIQGFIQVAATPREPCYSGLILDSAERSRIRLLQQAEISFDIVDGKTQIIKDRHWAPGMNPIVVNLSDKEVTMLLMGLLPKSLRKEYINER
jgi:hypothetical protein